MPQGARIHSAQQPEMAARKAVGPARLQVQEALVLDQFPSPLVLRLQAALPPAGQASLSVVATVVHAHLIGMDATRRLVIPLAALQPGGSFAVA